MPQKILITGAAGFIGSNLCKSLLKKGWNVTGIDNFDPFYDRSFKEHNLSQLKNNPEFQFIEMDITDVKSYKTLDNDFSVVVHLAAKAGVQPSLKDPSGYVRTNIDGTTGLMEWMHANDIKNLVFASSSSVYGNSGKGPFIESQNVDRPVSFYASTKKSCELLNYVYYDLYGFNILNLRFFTVYGPHQRPDLAIHKFFKLIHDNKPIQVYGDGSTGRDYTYIDDTVFGIEGAIDYVLNNEHVYEIVNLGNSKPVLLKELIEQIEHVIQKPIKKSFIAKQPGDVDYTFADITKAKRLFGYNPNTPMETGLKNFYNWFLEYYKTSFK